jgi:hypothetical protein
LLINQIPDRVTRWFGASDHSDESHHVNAIVGAVNGGARQAIVRVVAPTRGRLWLSRGRRGAMPVAGGQKQRYRRPEFSGGRDRDSAGGGREGG